jgi:hypothetical protein
MYGYTWAVFMHFGQGRFSPELATTTEHILTRGLPSVVFWVGVASILNKTLLYEDGTVIKNVMLNV